ncbi:MAG: cyclic nucleotide-binding domain-containing protein [Deltaproteobacteria bacterium]|nr:cyclic nucleotide-binding domain-containing protein [Deltaproteobacteria bacterium]
MGSRSVQENKEALLRHVHAHPTFSLLPTETVLEIFKNIEPVFCPAGSVILQEGREADRFFLLLKGKVEVILQSSCGVEPITLLSEGDFFGEEALFDAGKKRTASVRAVTPVEVASVTCSLFDDILSRFPEVRWRIKESATQHLLVNFLKCSTPFQMLSPTELQQLARRSLKVTIPAKELIIGEGEWGRNFYLIRRGQVQILRKENETEKQIEVLGPGSLFGEASLLTASPRNATVCAVENCDLLVFEREDLLRLIGSDKKFALYMKDLLKSRDRPRRAGGIEVHQTTVSNGPFQIVLEDRQSGRQLSLSPEGFFIWQQLDGKRTLAEVQAVFTQKFQRESPHFVAETVATLISSDFVISRVDPLKRYILFPSSLLRKGVSLVRHFFNSFEKEG